MKILPTILIAGLLGAAANKMRMEDLPTAVRNAVTEQTKTATLTAISREVEKGNTLYEIETKVSGKTRDLILNSSGSLLSIEEEVDLDSVPAAAKAALQKRAAGATVVKVERVTVGSTVSYEAAITFKSGRKGEVAVNADGSPHK